MLYSRAARVATLDTSLTLPYSVSVISVSLECFVAKGKCEPFLDREWQWKVDVDFYELPPPLQQLPWAPRFGHDTGRRADVVTKRHICKQEIK